MAETKITVPQESTNQKQDIMSQIKGFLNKFHNKSGNEKKSKDRPFNLTHRDAIITLLIAICIAGFACVYGWNVWQNYLSMNSRSDELKDLSTYSVSLSDSVDQYAEGNSKSTINGAIDINNNIADVLADRENFKKEQKNYYEVLLQNIYLPSLNVWKNPYTEDFDVTIMGEKYLEKNKFQDLSLILQRSDFVKNVGNDAEYNNIESISIGGEMVEMEDSDYFYLPITIRFSSPNKRSFLLLVNKLSMTSNVNNISLVNEFFFYLLMNIKERKAEAIHELMQKYRPEFSSSSAWKGYSELTDLTEEQLSDYQNKVIGYELNNWINYDGTGQYNTPLIDDDLIIETIKENTMCESTISDSECFYNFREKYRDLPYLAYKIGMEKQSNRTKGFREFLKDLPSIITITNFSFDKISNSSFLNYENEKYEGDLSFNTYGKTISLEELDEAATKLGKLCFGSTSNQPLYPDIALNIVNESITQLGGLDSNVNINSLQELKGIFEELADQYPGLTHYNKMIKIFETWRMLNDANLCKY